MTIGRKNKIFIDILIIALSVALAIVLVESRALDPLLAKAAGSRFAGSFLAGFFFVSVFTAVPAGVVLFQIAGGNGIWAVALFGGIGALLGDLIIFKFIKDSLAEDMSWLIRKTGKRRIIHVFRLKLFRWLVPFVGALIVVSPLPDEIGLAMMGLSKIKTWVFVPVSFVLNFLGILTIGLFAKGIF